MLKRFFTLALLVIPLFGAGSVVQVGPTRLSTGSGNLVGNTWTLTLTVTGDASTGSVPDTVLNSAGIDIPSLDGMTIVSMVTDPGSPAPTTLYDIVITDARGYDLLGATGANRSATVTENAAPTAPVPINGAITFSLSNNSVASAVVTVVITMSNTTVAKNGGSSSGSYAPNDATYLLQTANASLANAQAMGALATGLVKNTTTTGVQSIVVPGTGVETWITTPSSANLAAALTDETGTGAAVFANTPTLVTPVLGVATATSLNGTINGTFVSHLANVSATLKSLDLRNNGVGGMYANFSRGGGGSLIIGIETAAGGAIFTGGAGNSASIGNALAFPFQIATNDTIRATFLSAGNIILGTNSVSDAGGSQKVQVAGGVGTNGILITGTPFTVSGCSAVSPVGGATGGTFASGATGACTPTVTMGGSGFTAGTGFACTVNNLTTANLMRQTASTTTTATFSGTTVSGDVISFACDAY